MRKLKLEDLEVDSFVTTAATNGRKTVRAYAVTEVFDCTGGNCSYAGCTLNNCTAVGCTGASCAAGCTDGFGCSHDCGSSPYECSETYTGACADTCDPYVCSNNVTCPWGYPTCNENC